MQNHSVEKEIIILGAIGNTERQNRDNMRVLAGGGYDLHAEITHRQRPSPCTQKIQKAGKFSNHQWGVVYYGNGVSPTLEARDYKYPTVVIKKWKRSVSKWE